MPRGDLDDAFQQGARIHRAGGIVRVDQHQGARARRDQRFDLVRIGQVAVLGEAAVVARHAAVEDGRGAPQRIVRAGQQHFVAGLQQGAQAHVDQFADAVADEDALDFHMPRAAGTLLRGDGFARFFQTLLVTVGFALVQMRGDRFAQVIGHGKAVAAGVADIELDDRLAGSFQSRARRVSAPRIS
jgi:hypothetical protein